MRSHHALALSILLAPMAAASTARATAILNLANLDSITVWEDSRVLLADPLNEVIVSISDPRLSARLATLDASSNDFASSVGEFYDFFVSDSDGTPNLQGEFLTIEAAFDTAPSNGGNINRIDLNFANRPPEFASSVASFVVLGPGSAATVVNAVDGDLNTGTLLGNTAGSSQRLRLTVGFASTAVPEPGIHAMLVGPLSAGLLAHSRRRRSVA